MISVINLRILQVQDINEQVTRTSAKRKLICEVDLLAIKHRLDLGVTLNLAVRLIVPEISNVAAIKLCNWYTEMQLALDKDDYVLHDSMRNSLFPYWLPDKSCQNQPDNATYVGQFPYGYWEIT